MMHFVCPSCGQDLPDRMALKLTPEGWPVAASVAGQAGFPVIEPPVPFDILLDGIKQTRVVAYSLPRRSVWRLSELVIDGFPVVEKSDGEVTLVPLGQAVPA